MRFKGQYLVCRLATLLSGARSLEMVGVVSPPQMILGQSTTLECNFELEGSQLYSVKWYKNGREFYQFMPSMSPQYNVFSVEGVHIDLAYATNTTVHMSAVTLHSGGIYRCDVSNEYPVFDTVSQSVHLNVVAIPSGPYLSSLPTQLFVGDKVDINCSVSGSLPDPTIIWSINKKPVQRMLNSKRGIGEPNTELYSSRRPDGRVDMVLRLALIVNDEHFEEGLLHLKCTTFLGDIFMKSDDIVCQDGDDGNVFGSKDLFRMSKISELENNVEGKLLRLFDDEFIIEEQTMINKANFKDKEASITTSILICVASLLRKSLSNNI